MEFIAHPKYRFHLYLYSFIIIILGAVLAGWGVYRTLPAGLGEGYHTVQATLRVVEQVLFWRVALLYSAIAVLIIAATIALHLFYSHRIAGPAYRIGLEAAKIGNGSLQATIKLREKDNLMDVADSLNDLASRYQTRIATINETLLLIERQTQTAQNMIKAGTTGSELQQVASDITASVNKIENNLAEMQI